MLGRTHFLGGMAAGAAVGLATGQPILGMVLGGIGGLLPDIDHPGSIIGRALPFISIPFSVFFKHRTITHSVWFCIGISLLPIVIIYLFQYSGITITFDAYFSGIYILAGSLSHLILDAPTNSGVQPFWPVPFRLKGPLRTGDEFIELPLSAIFLILAINMSGVLNINFY